MTTQAIVTLSDTWTLIHSGEASGVLSRVGGPAFQVFFGNLANPPVESSNGTPVESGITFSMRAGDLLWGRATVGFDAQVRVETNMVQPVITPIDMALVMESYIEYNVKRGNQHEASVYVASLAANAAINSIIVTGSKPMAIKLREIEFNGGRITTELYRNPVYSGGTPIVTYNLSDINPVASTISILGGATISDNGTQVGSGRTLLGSTGQGQSRPVTGIVTGLERDLASNSVYLSRVVNTWEEAQEVSTYTSWYEGILS